MFCHKKIMKPFFVVFFLALFAFLICFPELYWFEDKLSYKNYLVFYDKKIPNQIYSILDEVDKLVKKSDFYNPKVTLKIYLRSNEKNYNSFFPGLFPKEALGWIIPIVKNIYLWKSDISKNKTYQANKPEGYSIPLHYAITHEVVHALIENDSFLKSKILARMNKNNYMFGPFGFLWKEEGYAEYIAGGQFSLPVGILELKKVGQTCDKFFRPGNGAVEYFKYFLCIKYLLEVKKMLITEIFEANLEFEKILKSAIEFFDEK